MPVPLIMGAIKRAGEDASSPRASKQLKIDAYLTTNNTVYALPTVNKFSPLANLTTDNFYEEEVKADSAASLEEDGTLREADRTLYDPLLLTAKTVKIIFERLNKIEDKIDQLSQLCSSHANGGY